MSDGLSDGFIRRDGDDYAQAFARLLPRGEAWSRDPDSDRLQARLAALVEQSAAGSEPIPETFAKVRAAALEAAGRSPSPAGRAEPILAGSTEGRPRLTEPWFC